MLPFDVVLLQKPPSPLAGLLEQALERECRAVVWKSSGPPLPEVSLGGQGLVLWDVTGFSAVEVDGLSQVLTQVEAGVVVACAAMDELAELAARRTRALTLLVAPTTPAAVAAAMEVALPVHRRLFALVGERDSLQQQLADRQVIEQAKRVLMTTRGLGEQEAMRDMQKRARDTNQKLINVARGLLKAQSTFNGNGNDGKS